MTARLIQWSDLRETPWKNGGGTTTEIAVFPEGAGLEGFDWRLSAAVVASNGPFSEFPGIDRTLLLVDGEGLGLAFGDGRSVRLTAASPPFRFPGDVPVAGTLSAGPVRDLNVLSRRGTVRAEVDRIGGTRPLPALTGQAALFVLLSGAVTVTVDGEPDVFRLHETRLDTLLLTGSALAQVVVERAPGSEFVLVQFHAAAGQPD